MSQATRSTRPYHNSNLFLSHYLDERVRERNEWDCDEASQGAMAELQLLYGNERGLVEGYNEDPLIHNWIEEVLDELKEQSLVLLYRLMFVLYAEVRGLIHPEGQRAQEEYEDNFSLDALRSSIHDSICEAGEGFAEAFSEHPTRMWSRCEDLFRLVDEGEASLGVPPYNRGCLIESFMAELPYRPGFCNAVAILFDRAV